MYLPRSWYHHNIPDTRSRIEFARFGAWQRRSKLRLYTLLAVLCFRSRKVISCRYNVCPMFPSCCICIAKKRYHLSSMAARTKNYHQMRQHMFIFDRRTSIVREYHIKKSKLHCFGSVLYSRILEMLLQK